MAQKPQKKSASAEKDQRAGKAAGSSAAKASGKSSGRSGASKAAKTRKPGELSRFQKGVIIAFIAIFALSTVAGAFASMVQTDTSQEASQGTDGTDSSSKTTVEDVDANYQGIVSGFQEKVDADATDKASLLSLARYSAQWGLSVRSVASTDAETSHANELFEQAISAYDRYLELEDSTAARVDRALCLYYEGETSNAVQELEDITEADPDYAIAWANLGMLYEASGSTDDAKAAYETAAEKDPDDEYGAKTYAEQRLSAIESAQSSSSDGSSSGSSSSGSSSTSLTGDLTTDLSNATGAGL